ncbi:S8 family serine peptidase [Bradyrhizobium jicamae]|uniref:S8 family serine peptidase n=1 Tax=Bradyrhizobium jicamae TaxID=280332 RepID=A0ABS5FNU8_9BRAD|nr:S8 family serine peptidase [Bradyrhizobium jicamae]
MNRNCPGWPTSAAVAVAVAIFPLMSLSGPAAHAQSFMRSPTIRIAPRVSIGPRINPNVASKVGANTAVRNSSGITARTGTSIAARNGLGITPKTVNPGPVTPKPVTPNVVTPKPSPPDRGPPPPRIETIPRLAVGSTLPYARYSPNLYPACEDAYRGSDGGCYDRPVALMSGGSSKGVTQKSGTGAGGNTRVAQDRRTVPNQLVAEIDSALTDAQADALARRHGLTRIASQNIPLLGVTVGLFRIAGNRPLEAARLDLAGDGSVRSVQPNYRYLLQDQQGVPSEGDPAQYALAQLHLPQAHTLARGMNVTVAVIDSGVDAAHPELANTIADNFDALGSKEGPHVHGTGVAGAIAAHAKLMGGAPEVRILAIRAFGAGRSGAESTSYVILKGLDYAVLHGAQIVNMSFAGPKDTLIGRAVAATAAKGIVLVAAAGNAGAKSPPLYPAADPEVIAVSGTDAKDGLFTASNRGSHIALAAPGVDILLPAPDGKYQMTSGTSFSAAFITGIAALMLERSPALQPNEVRAILTGTARDIGAPGRDDLFGAGEADAFAAVTASSRTPAVPVVAVSDKLSQPPKAPDGNNTSVSRAPDGSTPSTASDKSAANDANRPDAQ